MVSVHPSHLKIVLPKGVLSFKKSASLPSARFPSHMCYSSVVSVEVHNKVGVLCQSALYNRSGMDKSAATSVIPQTSLMAQ